jgi:hypothetical protein
MKGIVLGLAAAGLAVVLALGLACGASTPPPMTPDDQNPLLDNDAGPNEPPPGTPPPAPASQQAPTGPASK